MLKSGKNYEDGCLQKAKKEKRQQHGGDMKEEENLRKEHSVSE